MDKLVAQGVPLSTARKAPICIGMMGASLIFIAAYTEGVVTTVAVLGISYTFLISASAAIWAIPGDLSDGTKYVGRIGGIQNTVSNVGKAIAPIVTGLVWDHTGSFAISFFFSAIIAVCGVASYLLVVQNLEPIQSV